MYAQFSAGMIHPQTSLSTSEISTYEKLGRTTAHSLKFGTLASVKGDSFEVFILSPLQRIAYTSSEEASTHHVDILKSELRLNRLRIDVLSYEQRHSRQVVLLDKTSKKKLQPAHAVLDMDQVVAEFDMNLVITLGGPTGDVLIQITDESGRVHPNVPFNLRSLVHPYRKFENEFFK